MRAAGRVVSLRVSSEAVSTSRHLAILLACCGFLSGCTGTDFVVGTGTVAFDGVPVETGLIVFHPLDRGVAPQGASIVAGRFTIRCRPGRHRVEIRGTRAIDESQVPPTMPRLPDAPIREDFIPAAYNTESMLEATVTAGGPNLFDFELESPGSSG